MGMGRGKRGEGGGGDEKKVHEVKEKESSP